MRDEKSRIIRLLISHFTSLISTQLLITVGDRLIV